MSNVEKFIAATEEQAETLFNGGTVVSPSGEQTTFEDGDVVLVPVSGGSKLYAHYITISRENETEDMLLTIKFVLYSYKSIAFETFTDFYNYMQGDNGKRCVNGRLFCETLSSYEPIFRGIFDQITIANNVVQVFATDLMEGLFSGVFNMADVNVITLTDEFNEVK